MNMMMEGVMSVIHFLNVQNGDCNIIEHNSERISVIDVCCARNEIVNEECSQEDSGVILNSSISGNYRQKEHPENPIRYLKTVVKCSSIFRYIQTHPDMDHMDGIKDLFTEFNVLNFWDTKNNKHISSDDFNKYRKEDWDYYQFIRKSTSDPKVLYLTDSSEGEFYYCENGDGLFILSPSKNLVNEANQTEDYNELSYVLLYQTGNKKIIFAGDSGKKTWDFILEKYKSLVSNIDILLAPHHGRKTGGNDEYLDVLKPKLTLFGNAESEHLDYSSWNNRNLFKITNNEAGNIVLEIENDEIKVFVSNKNFAQKFENFIDLETLHGYYIGSI